MMIFRYLLNNNLTDSPIIYLCPSVSKFFSFTLWDWCDKENVVIQTVPQNIFNYLRTGNMGIFEKLEPAFQQFVQKK